MADIEVVIKIPEEDYNFVKKQVTDGITNPLKIRIANGTPLPKGHGKLFDENKLKKELVRCECSGIMYDTLDHTLSYMKPIIEADKESD